jgi:hypothetical protein
MKITEAIDMQGRLSLHLENRAGEVQTIAANNAIVLTGRELVANLFAGLLSGAKPISHIAIGIGNAAINADTDKKLTTEIFRKAFNKITPDNITTVNSRKQILVSADFGFDEAIGALTEAGIFNADKDGTMYNRVVFPQINKTKDFKLTLVWEILF